DIVAAGGDLEWVLAAGGIRIEIQALEGEAATAVDMQADDRGLVRRIGRSDRDARREMQVARHHAGVGPARELDHVPRLRDLQRRVQRSGAADSGDHVWDSPWASPNRGAPVTGVLGQLDHVLVWPRCRSGAIRLRRMVSGVTLR